jgi:penicillin-binding protein 1A
MAPYFREVLRAKLESILMEEDKNGELIRKKGDGTRYDLYRDGLKVYTTIDSRMQAHAEFAVKEHLQKELQRDFTKDLSRRKAEKYPFYNGISESDQKRVMEDAIRKSDRYQFYTGKVCPECKRPKAYIHKEPGDKGSEIFHCHEKDGGCGATWPVRNDDEIDKIMNTPVPTKVYWTTGYRDTTLSPIDSIKYHKAILHAALMSVDPHTGHVKAWVGGVDFKYFKFDNVYQSRRQVGSTFKPLVYATALRNGDKPCSRYANLRTCIDLPTGARWCPDNSDGSYGGEWPLSYALANSVNTITAALIKKYGPESVIALAKNMGIKSKLPAVPSIALGVAELSLYEMVGANATFVNQGVYIEPTFITRIEDKNGNVLYEAEPVIQQALSPDVAYQTTMMMKGVIDRGTGLRLRGGRPYANIRYPMAGKTGTTQNNTDGWFMGLTPDLVTGVWVGAQDPTVRFSRTSLGQGANTGLPIYGYFMNRVYADKSIQISTKDFEPPVGYDAARFACDGDIDPFSDEDIFAPDEELPLFDGEGAFEGDEQDGPALPDDEQY